MSKVHQYRPDIPFAGSRSAAIKAAYHPPKDDKDPSSKPVMLEVVDGQVYGGATEKVKHCTFTSLEVERPVTGQLYA